MIETRGAGPDSPVGSHSLFLSRDASPTRGLGGPESAQTAQSTVAQAWERPAIKPGAPDAGWEHRVETLEARMEHLETVLEGLQDALYRQAVLEDEHVEELRRRTAPEQLARDLSQHARRRGL